MFSRGLIRSKRLGKQRKKELLPTCSNIFSFTHVLLLRCIKHTPMTRGTSNLPSLPHEHNDGMTFSEALSMHCFSQLISSYICLDRHEIKCPALSEHTSHHNYAMIKDLLMICSKDFLKKLRPYYSNGGPFAKSTTK